MVKALRPNAIILHGDGNLWWGGALHEEYKWLKANGKLGTYVMYANDDTTFGEGYIEKGIELIKEYPHSLITGCGYSRNSGKLIDTAVEWDFKTFRMAEITRADSVGNCASTRSLFMEIEALIKIGGFHPILLPHYGSDYEWIMGADDDAVEAAEKPEVKVEIRHKYGIALDDFLVITGGKIDAYGGRTED